MYRKLLRLKRALLLVNYIYIFSAKTCFLQAYSPLISSILTKSSSLQFQLHSTISTFSSFLDTLQVIDELLLKQRVYFTILINYISVQESFSFRQYWLRTILLDRIYYNVLPLSSIVKSVDTSHRYILGVQCT